MTREQDKLEEHLERITRVETVTGSMQSDLKEVKESVRTTNDILASMSKQLVSPD